MLITTSSADAKFSMYIRIEISNEHSGTDPCCAKYLAEHIYNLNNLWAKDKVIANIDNMISLSLMIYSGEISLKRLGARRYSLSSNQKDRILSENCGLLPFFLEKWRLCGGLTVSEGL